MKKKIITTVIAVLTSGMVLSKPADATVVFFDTADPLVMPGETISVSIFSTVQTEGIRMDRISDADFGTASNLYLNPDYGSWQFSEGIAVNSGGVLIEGVRGGWAPASHVVPGVLYSFDYLIPPAPLGHTITIFADPSNNAVNHVLCWVNSDLVYVTPESLSLTVVPEPITIVLLGMGGLLLARRTKRRL